jgi:outer membrane protein TolC
MSSNKGDAIDFLKSSVARYGEQLDDLQRRLSDGAGNLVEQTRVRIQHEQVAGLLEDAARLLSQLSGG